MYLHRSDLLEAKQTLDFVSPNNPDIVNRALAQSSIVLFYKCFGSSKFRNNSLNCNKILKSCPPGAKQVFEYYKNLRDKFIAHDESRFAQAYVWGVLDQQKEFPLVDVFGGFSIAETINGKDEITGLASFYGLVLATIQWVNSKINELIDLLCEQYKEKKMEDFQKFEFAKIEVPTQENMFKKRY